MGGNGLERACGRGLVIRRAAGEVDERAMNPLISGASRFAHCPNDAGPREAGVGVVSLFAAPLGSKQERPGVLPGEGE